MSDTRLRELERRWKETGSPDDEAAYLLERVRVGDLTQERLELAAYCGHEGACRATGLREAPLRLCLMLGGDLLVHVSAAAGIAEAALHELERRGVASKTLREALAPLDERLAGRSTDDLKSAIDVAGRFADDLSGHEWDDIKSDWRRYPTACLAHSVLGALMVGRRAFGGDAEGSRSYLEVVLRRLEAAGLASVEVDRSAKRRICRALLTVRSAL